MAKVKAAAEAGRPTDFTRAVCAKVQAGDDAGAEQLLADLYNERIRGRNAAAAAAIG